ncbi:MAG: PH domain-containing protein [Flavobacteriaceae bacterium]
MPTLEQVKNQIQKVDGLSKFLGKREIKELPNILWENENVENLIQGTYNNGNGILVATNKRLIFIDKGLVFGLKVEDFPYDKISSIQYSTGLLLGKLTIFASGNKAIIDNVEKQRVRLFGDFVRNKISSKENENASPATSSNEKSQDDIVTQLERLAKLKEKGILTDEEFVQQKQKLLGT